MTGLTDRPTKWRRTDILGTPTAQEEFSLVLHTNVATKRQRMGEAEECMQLKIIHSTKRQKMADSGDSIGDKQPDNLLVALLPVQKKTAQWFRAGDSIIQRHQLLRQAREAESAQGTSIAVNIYAARNHTRANIATDRREDNLVRLRLHDKAEAPIEAEDIDDTGAATTEHSVEATTNQQTRIDTGREQEAGNIRYRHHALPTYDARGTPNTKTREPTREDVGQSDLLGERPGKHNSLQDNADELETTNSKPTDKAAVHEETGHIQWPQQDDCEDAGMLHIHNTAGLDDDGTNRDENITHDISADAEVIHNAVSVAGSPVKGALNERTSFSPILRTFTGTHDR